MLFDGVECGPAIRLTIQNLEDRHRETHSTPYLNATDLKYLNTTTPRQVKKVSEAFTGPGVCKATSHISICKLNRLSAATEQN